MPRFSAAGKGDKRATGAGIFWGRHLRKGRLPGPCRPGPRDAVALVLFGDRRLRGASGANQGEDAGRAAGSADYRQGATISAAPTGGSCAKYRNDVMPYLSFPSRK